VLLLLDNLLFKSMIVVQLTGGLGNQLFQYAFARHLAHLNQSELMLDTSQVSLRSDFAHRRQFKLHHFQICAPPVMWDHLSERRFTHEGRKYYRSPPSLFRNLFRNKHFLHELKEQHFHYDGSALRQFGDFYITSYWQSPRYFQAVSHFIRSDLLLREPLSELHCAIRAQIQATPNSVAFIVRRGDFANHPHHSKFHGCCSREYYSEALEFIEDRVGIPHLFVFSDDIPWVRQNLHFDSPVTFMDHDYDHSDYDFVDMFFISCCRHHIIANSTFGWWGAWLSSSTDGIVIAPQRWFLDASIDTSDLIPSHWHRI
jgi:hypothetical protein